MDYWILVIFCFGPVFGEVFIRGIVWFQAFCWFLVFIRTIVWNPHRNVIQQGEIPGLDFNGARPLTHESSGTSTVDFLRGAKKRKKTDTKVSQPTKQQKPNNKRFLCFFRSPFLFLQINYRWWFQIICSCSSRNLGCFMIQMDFFGIFVRWVKFGTTN